MKKRYKFIHFEEIKRPLIGENMWKCYNNRGGYVLGTVEWYAEWMQQDQCGVC